MKIVIVDDDNLVSLSLKTILEASGKVTVAEIGKNGQEAISLYEKHLPDVLLMDIRMDTMTGLEAAEVILGKYPGAKGYILKQDFESLLPALTSVLNGQSVFGSEVVGKLPGFLDKTNSFDYSAFDITAKEMELIELIAEGLSNKEIAERLFLSEGTVRNYLSSVLEKLELRDRTQLAVFYYKNLK